MSQQTQRTNTKYNLRPRNLVEQMDTSNVLTNNDLYEDEVKEQQRVVVCFDMLSPEEDEIHTFYQQVEIMKSEQNRHRIYNTKARYLKYRGALIVFCKKLVEALDLHAETLHAAVQLIDRIFGKYEIDRTRAELVAISCVAISAKFEEIELRVPKASGLSEIMSHVYDQGLIRATELKVLDLLNWHVRTITTEHFLRAFAKRGIVFENEQTTDGATVSMATAHAVENYCGFYSTLSLSLYSIQQYLPSEVAAAIVGVSRLSCNLALQWNTQLTQLTGYTVEDLKPIVYSLYSLGVERGGLGKFKLTTEQYNSPKTFQEVHRQRQQYNRRRQQTR